MAVSTINKVQNLIESFFFPSLFSWNRYLELMVLIGFSSCSAGELVLSIYLNRASYRPIERVHRL